MAENFVENFLSSHSTNIIVLDHFRIRLIKCTGPARDNLLTQVNANLCAITFKNYSGHLQKEKKTLIIISCIRKK